MDTLIRPHREESNRIKNLLHLLLSSILFVCSGNAQPTAQHNKWILSVDTMKVETGWNLLSLPLIVTDGIKNSLFPTAVSDAFLYQNEYKAKDTLSNGYGFWMKFDSAETFVITGDTIFYDVMEVQPGWNLIGSLTTPAAVNMIRSNPIGIITSDFFYYSSGAGYQSADTIQPGKGYWVKVDQSGSIILDAVTGKTCPAVSAVEYEGKIYNTVQIGGQCWLKENLDVGIMINGIRESSDNDTIEKYCYNDIPANCVTYGGFYQWNEAMIYLLTAATQGICPPGWHIPTYAEIDTLITAVNYDGNALKAVGQGSEDGVGTNTSGFSALLSGIRAYTGDFSDLSNAACFWSSMGDLYSGYYLALWYNDNSISFYSTIAEYGLNVRCIWHVGGANRPPSVPTIQLPGDYAIEQPTVLTLQWMCDDIEGDPITYDIYFGTDNPPATKISSDLSDTYLIVGGLNESITHFWRVIAKDDHDNSTTGPVWSFTTGFWGTSCEGISTVEYAGKMYHTIQIGTQCWLKENLDIGTRINGAQEQTDNGVIEKWCYDDDSINCKIYGALYQWNEAMQYDTLEGTQGICPTGWHLPTYAEFDSLAAAVNEDGNALKAVGQGSWFGTGTNTTGFTGLLAGNSYDGEFTNLYVYTFFWSSTQDDYGPPYLSAIDLALIGESSAVGRSYDDKLNGLSVRCLKD